jgi:hypothetical protein
MSIASSIYADYANAKRREWLKELEEAYAACDWQAVANLIYKMKREGFSE